MIRSAYYVAGQPEIKHRQDFLLLRRAVIAKSGGLPQAAQGCRPDVVACAGETLSLPLMKILSALLLLSVLGSCYARATEGFWLPHQLSAGSPAPVAPAELYDNPEAPAAVNAITRSVVKLGECSAVFVSADGLLLTSARCLRPYLPAELRSGFAAEQRQDEIRLSGLTAYQPTEQQDMTVAINRQLNETATPAQRYQRLAGLEQELLGRCQQQNRYCELNTLHYGLQFALQYYQPLADVRLVYLPPQPDDMQDDTRWPRYDADFTLLRLYNTAGKPVSASYAKLAAAGAAEQQLVLVPDFVPQSRRYSSAEEVQFLFEQLYPQAQTQLKRTINVLQHISRVPVPDMTRLLAELEQQYQRRQAMLAEYQQGNLLGSRQQQQQQIRDWITTSPVRQQLYGAALQQFRDLQQQQQQLMLRDQVLENLQYARLPALAVQLYQHALLTDEKSRAEHQAQLQQQLAQLETGFDARTDQELALHFLELYAELPQPQRLPALDQYFALSDGFTREIVRHKLSAIYRLTGLTRASARLAWLAADAARFRHSDDPLINFAVAMQDTSQQLAQQRQQLAVQLEMARAALMEVIMAYNDARGQPTYAEANGGLRLSLGRVSGYQPRDAVWYLPFSRIQSADGSKTAIHANFLSSVDSCGDMTGAPTFNHNADIVGIMYTGAGQRLLADWHYEAGLSRAVHVDSRFILWHLQQSAAGRSLLQEMVLAH